MPSILPPMISQPMIRHFDVPVVRRPSKEARFVLVDSHQPTKKMPHVEITITPLEPTFVQEKKKQRYSKSILRRNPLVSKFFKKNAQVELPIELDEPWARPETMMMSSVPQKVSQYTQQSLEHSVPLYRENTVPIDNFIAEEPDLADSAVDANCRLLVLKTTQENATALTRVSRSAMLSLELSDQMVQHRNLEKRDVIVPKYQRSTLTPIVEETQLCPQTILQMDSDAATVSPLKLPTNEQKTLVTQGSETLIPGVVPQNPSLTSMCEIDQIETETLKCDHRNHRLHFFRRESIMSTRNFFHRSHPSCKKQDINYP